MDVFYFTCQLQKIVACRKDHRSEGMATVPGWNGQLKDPYQKQGFLLELMWWKFLLEIIEKGRFILEVKMTQYPFGNIGTFLPPKRQLIVV
ncbi:hypothetical protein TNIN_379871 [Trichonephila inaurata madagascariensis]|uniref:Uncharacterized protein n=1 Tax=Trichonephila inaurata madagascariensis TaxID=2747483 RepID=A0A8X6XEZ2_9ARAC|nr:hypothetical protein TNIN_379861 [Trichonephila inaurata madagascariensis]GFY52567.1 hypothetical protein TNIN_379871 [Trichonephila inaurata madagascariensis]